MFQENPPDLDSPKSGPNLLHVLTLYFSICSMGKVKTHCTAVDAPWRRSGKVFPSMHAWPGTLWLSLGWYFLPVWSVRAAAAVGTVWRATACSRVLFLLSRAGWWALPGCSGACRSFDVMLKRNFPRAWGDIFFAYVSHNSSPVRITWTYFNYYNSHLYSSLPEAQSNALRKATPQSAWALGLI